MTSPWLHIIGIGEDGRDGLTPATQAVLDAADIVIGAERHHNLLKTDAETLSWPSPFDTMLDVLANLQKSGKRVAVLATGDPLWYSVGARLGREIPADEIRYYPQLSAFQLASARMGWSMADVETLTVHGRPVEQMIAFIQPDQRLLILTTGAKTPSQIASFLTERGFGQSRLTVLAHMGGSDEARFEDCAIDWAHEVPEFNTLAVECIADKGAALLPRVPGLADNLFEHDGTMTKAEVRSATLSRLMPMRGALLWDIGTGCGSIGIEWMRAARFARAIGVEPRADRIAMAAGNAANLGTPQFKIIQGTAPDALSGLEMPDAVFIGGGLSVDVAQFAYDALRPLGRLVANAVTLESEAVLIGLREKMGGELVKIQVHRAESVGPRMGWRPFMPVTQWSLIKR